MNLIWCPRSHKISPLSFQQHCIFLSMFLTQLSVDVFFTKLQHSGGRSVCTAAAPHNTPQNTSCGQALQASERGEGYYFYLFLCVLFVVLFVVVSFISLYNYLSLLSPCANPDHPSLANPCPKVPNLKS